MKKRITALVCLLAVLITLPCPAAFAAEAEAGPDWVLADAVPEDREEREPDGMPADTGPEGAEAAEPDETPADADPAGAEAAEPGETPADADPEGTEAAEPGETPADADPADAEGTGPDAVLTEVEVTESDWVLANAAPEGATIVARKWAYTKENQYDVSSPDEARPGSELLGSDWVQTGSGSVNCASIPAGFDTSHWLYSNLNHAAYTGWSNDSTKREVSKTWAGYVYWHWMYDCGNANGNSTRAIYNRYGRGPDNGLLYKYFGAFQSTNGNYSSDRYYCNSQSILNYIIPERKTWNECQGATRWFRFDYYRSSYVDYQKVYHYRETLSGETEDRDAIPLGALMTEYVKYQIVVEHCPAPRMSKESGSRLFAGERLEIFCDDPQATIHYAVTAENMTPDKYQVYSGPFVVSASAGGFWVHTYSDKTGAVESERVHFAYTVTPESSVPVVTTLEADHVTDTSAVLRAKVESKTELISLSFLYFEKNNSRSRKTVEVLDGDYVLISGLTPGTEYRYQAIAMNEYGQSSGNVLSFKTLSTGADEPASIELTPSYLVVKAGESRQLLATILPATAVSGVYWQSDDPAVATVDQNGMVTAVGNGQTRISATTVSGRLNAYCTIEVMNRPDVTGDFDFSELNMIMRTSLYNETNGFDVKYDTGGNSIMASAYLARWEGTVSETTDPYPANGVVTNYNASRKTPADYHVQEILYLPWRSDSLDNNEIKKAVMSYGAVYTAFHVREADFSADDISYYHAKQYSNDVGHAVAIVGWDDDYPASRFKTTPPGNGAFLCKNSWGEGRGENGYFYISYYDVTLARNSCLDINSVFYHLQSKDNFNKIYQYDMLGPITKYIFPDKTGWYANVFPSSGEVLAESEVLKAVSFYTVSPSTEYELYVVQDYQGASSFERLGKPIKSGTIDYAGYHTIMLREPERLAAGTRFAVVVKITEPGNKASIFVETPVANFSSRARAGQDESYVREDGSWTDLTTIKNCENTNVCLKAFTSADPDAELMEVSSPKYADDTVHTMEELMAAGFPFNPAYVEQEEQTRLLESDGELYTGLIAPIILPELSTSYNYAEGSQFPSSYDLRDEGCVTPVRNQGRLGSCWSFATYASLESSVLRAASSEYASVGGLNQAAGEKSIDLSAPFPLLGTGNSVQLTATIRPYGSEETIVWSSSNPDVATVSPRGIVTAHSTGNAVITVSTEDGAASANCTILVSSPVDAAAISLYSPEGNLTAGEVSLIDYKIYPTNAKQSKLFWESDNPAVAVVDQYGMVTGVGSGTATITAYTADRKASQSLQLTVAGDSCLDTRLEENRLRLEGGTLRGALTFRVKNNGTETEDCTFILAFYTADGKLIGTTALNQKIGAGEERPLSWNINRNVPANTGSFCLYSLRKESYTPLAQRLTRPLNAME